VESDRHIPCAPAARAPPAVLTEVSRASAHASDGEDSYIYGPDDRIGQINQANVQLYLHGDEVGSTRVITDDSGATAAAFSYSAHGTPNGSTGSASTPLGYDGQYTDPESQTPAVDDAFVS
jgi:hypothetical protein